MFLQQSLYQTAEMDEQSQEIVLMKKYKLMDKIGSGSFGSIYKCQNLIDKQHYAVKLVKNYQTQEKKGKGQGQLQYQIKLYQIFQGIPGVSRLYDFGTENQRLFMIIDLLSYSLEDLFQLCDKHLSLATTLNIGIQIITRLEHIHRKGFVHRDIKANNFMIGKRDKIKTVYVIDFGLAKRYKDIKTGKHIQIKGGKSLVGTARYASIASHQGYEQCRRDDLESLGYLMLYFLKGKLPWQGIQIPNKVEKYAQIGKMKMQADISLMCLQINERALVIAKYMEAVKKIQFQECPNYDNLRKILKEDLIKYKEENKPFDWQKKLARSVQKKERRKTKNN